MDNIDRLDLAKKMLCQEIMEATSAFDLAKRLWDTGNVECHNHRLSEISGMMPVLVVFERLSDGELYYKRLDPNNASEWNHWNGRSSDWMGAEEVEASLAQFTEKELAIVKTHMWGSRDHDRDRKFGRRYVCLAKPEWLRYDLQGDELSDAVYLSLQM